MISRAWNDAETRLVLDMWHAGKSAGEIAAVVGRSSKSVLGRAQRLYGAYLQQDCTRKPRPNPNTSKLHLAAPEEGDTPDYMDRYKVWERSKRAAAEALHMGRAA